LREQFNQRAKGLFLAYAQQADLDNLAAPFGVTRKQLTPPDPEAGTPAVFETDTEFRRRIQLAPEGLSVAGPEGAYIFHTLSADNAVLDASATSPAPGEVVVTVLARDGDGTPSDELLATVNA
ncbi:baseplate J/gp47 family protein, partial [Mesorhizobium sp. M1C.F.Ca.ET.187.01.1.1]|uniref:baseplate J/gp47 family protein n=1 Tax=Mesorhizobium sp. M1C.F.Ca.ET.187.01.1.1 TaxID=2563923 RepID=UPI00113D1654